MVKVLGSQRGFMLVEVLVSAAVFMIGFSVLVFMLERMIVGYSAEEITTATNLATSVMEQTLAARDTVGIDTTLMIGEIRYRIDKKVNLKNGLAAVEVQVSRERTGKELCRLYAELVIP